MATKKKSPSKTPRKPRKVNFDNEAGVLKEIARVLELDANDLNIKRSSAPNGYGDAYQISEGGSRGQEWIVMENEEEFDTAAVNGVERDLDDEPELFNRNFIESHINIERLRNDLMSDVQDSRYEDLREEASKHPMKFIADNGLELHPPSYDLIHSYAKMMADESKTLEQIEGELDDMGVEEMWETIGEEPEVDDEAIVEVAEAEASAQLKDPVSYLEDIYGKEDGIAQAIKIAGIDTKAAAEEAVRTDGAAHFMCSYDGDYDTSPSGFIYWRHN